MIFLRDSFSDGPQNNEQSKHNNAKDRKRKCCRFTWDLCRLSQFIKLLVWKSKPKPKRENKCPHNNCNLTKNSLLTFKSIN